MPTRRNSHPPVRTTTTLNWPPREEWPPRESDAVRPPREPGAATKPKGDEPPQPSPAAVQAKLRASRVVPHALGVPCPEHGAPVSVSCWRTVGNAAVCGSRLMRGEAAHASRSVLNEPIQRHRNADHIVIDLTSGRPQHARERHQNRR